MKHFVREDKFNDSKEIKELDELQKEKDQLDIKGIKPSKKEKKPADVTFVKANDKWLDAITTTLVNFRESNKPNSRILSVLRGGEVIKVSDSLIYGDYRKVNYKGRIGFINKDYVREI